MPHLPAILALLAALVPAARAAPGAPGGPGAPGDPVSGRVANGDEAAQEAPAPFVESELDGLRTTCGTPAKDWIVEVNGPGLLAGDLDGDGDHDLVVVDGSTVERVRAGRAGLPPRVFLADGRGSLAEAGEAWAIAPGRFGTGGALGDVEGDGDLDVVVLEWGRDRLLENQGGAGLREVAAPGFVGERWATSAAFLDHDRDGDLDLAVVNYLRFDPEEVPARASGACRWKGHAVMCGPEGLEAVHDQLYRNDGAGRFEEVSEAAGMRPRRAAFGLGVTTLDLEHDGDTDLYVTNDSTPNHLWRNEGGRFVEVGLPAGVALDANGKEQAGMGLASGDLNDDGLPDLFVTNFSGEENALYVSTRPGRWRERASAARLGGPSRGLLGWGTALEDFDLDGDLDLVVFDGHVYPQADEPGTDTRYAQPDLFHRNRGALRFESEPLSARAASVSRACAVLELDGDGAPDLVAADLDGPVRLLRNTTPAGSDGHHWLVVRLAGRGGNRQGLGARVSAVWEGGAAWRELRSAGGYQAAAPAEARFGLGAARRVEELLVEWPTGATSRLGPLEVDRVLVVAEPEPSAQEPAVPSGPAAEPEASGERGGGAR